MTDALGDALQRQAESWQRQTGGFPRAPWEDNVDPFIWVGEKDREGWCSWRPFRKQEAPPLAEFVAGLDPLHASIHSYFDSWWFLALEGRLGERMLSFEPNRPGPDPAQWVDQLRNYAAAHDGRLAHAPLGVDNKSDLQIVVDNRTGELAIEDWERGTHEVIAESLDDALRRLVV